MSKTIRDELKDTYLAKGGQQGDLTNDSQTIAGMIKAINTAEANNLTPLSLGEPASDLNFWGVTPAEAQSDIVISDGEISGKLYEMTDESKAIVADKGKGYYICLKFNNIDADATSVMVGMEPTQGSGPSEIINDPDKAGIFKVTYKESQIFKVVQSNASYKRTQCFSLSGLELIPADAE